MNGNTKSIRWEKLIIILAVVVLGFGLGTTQALAVDTLNNNLTMLDGDGGMVGGANDVRFTWDETMKTSVAVSGQVSNATITSDCPFFGVPWFAHDVTVYGPGTYTVYTACAAGSPGCGDEDPAHPAFTFTVGAGELGAHMLFDWGGNTNIDVVNVWTPNAVFGPSPLHTGACGANADTTVWDGMSKDGNSDGINGYPMVDGPFQGMNANFNVMGPVLCAGVVCNDGNVCTDDACNAGVCENANNTAACDDSDACTSGDVCSGGACGGAVVSCDDLNVCTTDTCDTATGCVNANNGTCASGDLATPAGVDVADALKALRIAAGIDTPTQDEIYFCDVAPLVNGTSALNGTCDIGDVVVILRKAVGLIL